MNIEKIKKDAEKAASEWLAQADVPSRVRQALDLNVKIIAASLLGFEHRWGEWEVDHCNGRSGESAAGDYLREKCSEAIKEWLEDLGGNLPPLPMSAKKSLVAAYHERLQHNVREILMARAKRDAEAIAEEIIAVAVEKQIEAGA